MTGGVLVAVASVATFAAYRGAAAGPTHRYVVAAHDIAAGTTLTAGDLTTSTVDLPEGLSDHAFAQPGALAGRLALTPLAAGELVQSSAVADASKADPRYDVSLPLERSRALGGAIVAGERVDVISTFGTGSDARTVVVARRAEVVRVLDAKRATVGGTGDVVLELAVPTAGEVLAITHASQAGSVTIVRATGIAAAGIGDEPGEYRLPAPTATKGG